MKSLCFAREDDCGLWNGKIVGDLCLTCTIVHNSGTRNTKQKKQDCYQSQCFSLLVSLSFM